MFMDDSAFEDSGFKKRDLSPKRRGEQAKYTSGLRVEELDNFDDGDAFGSAGGLGAESSSRARMLAQQREIQLKARQKAMASGGMIRSSLDEVRTSADSQFTPAVRQFSAPKTVKDGSSDAQGGEDNSEFRVPPARKPVAIPAKMGRASRFSDDEDEDTSDYRRRPQGGASKASAPVQRSRFDDDDDEDGGNYRNPPSKGQSKKASVSENRGRNAQSKRWTSASRERDFDEEEENSEPPRDRDRDAVIARGNQWQPASTAETIEAAPMDLVRPVPAVVAPLNLSNMRQFLTRPLPKANGVVQCYIRRNKNGTNRLFPVYSLYLKDGDRFLMSSKKRPNNKTSNYLISMGEGDLSRDGANYLGKVRSNFVGTEFQIFDNGSNPNDHDDVAGSHVRKDLGAVMYAPNVLGSRGPRKMQVAIPTVTDEPSDAGRSRTTSAAGDECILTRMKDHNHAGLAYLINKPPRWNEQVGAYVLNFSGRVTMASVKNFQLVDPDEHNIVVLQFGRVAKDEFTMDMQYPISPLQAFAITLSSFDSKIACD